LVFDALVSDQEAPEFVETQIPNSALDAATNLLPSAEQAMADQPRLVEALVCVQVLRKCKISHHQHGPNQQKGFDGFHGSFWFYLTS
jgi:hypothetical protein